MNADSLVMGVPLWVVAVAASVFVLLLLLIVLAIAKSGGKSTVAAKPTNARTNHAAITPSAGSAPPSAPAVPVQGPAEESAMPKHDIFEGIAFVPASASAAPPPTASALPSAVATPATPEEILVPTSDANAWEICWGLRHRVVDGRLQVDGAIRSSAGLPAEPGATYLCEYSVRAPRSLMGGRPLIYFAGPIALNMRGEIIQTFAEQTPITVEEGTRKGSVQIEASPDAHSIYVGLQGPTGEDKLGVLPEFDWIRLTRQ